MRMSSMKWDSSRPLAAFAAALALVGIAACGGSPPPASAPPAAAPSAPAAAASGSPKVEAPAKADAPPTAKVLGVAVSDKGDHFTRVTVSFTNPSSKPCKIPSYTLAWPGGTKEFPLDNFTLAPGQSQTRAMRVHPKDGDLTKLTDPDVTQISFQPQCGL
ncbi:Hypothetical protein A7982_05306 [Minicystis rosea]|nr:Hypothetical protein A7982_05306 [Minicystis rosea]